MNRIPLSFLTLTFAVVALAVTRAPISAQIDVSGTWMLEVSTDGGITTPVLTLVQAGDMLTGTYSSEVLGQNEVQGSVNTTLVTVTFSAMLQGQSVPVVYRGEIDQHGKMSGTLDIADGMLTGTFTGTRSNQQPW